MSDPKASWGKVGDGFYRKVKLYESILDQELELEKHIIAGSYLSGALALFRNQERIQTYRDNDAAKSTIDVYSCSGRLISRLNWDRGSIRGLGWSEEEQLVVVTGDGTVRCYNGLLGDFTQFTLGIASQEKHVVSCRFWSHGLVALLSTNELIVVSNYDEPRPKLLAEPPPGEVHAWTIIPPAQTLSRSVEVFMAVGRTIYHIDTTEAEDRGLPNGPFKHVSVSPNGQHVALYTEDGTVWIITSDFQTKTGEHESKSRTIPKDVQWCGNDSILLAWEDEVHMLGSSGTPLTYYYDGWVHLLPDIDGVRVITNDLCEFFQRVPASCEEIFKLGSSSPAAVLLDAVTQLDKQSTKADENLRLIRPQLADAVTVCIEAASQEFDHHWQKQLLKAASYGKSVIDLYCADDFVDTCETLRILNAARDYKIGMPLTTTQYYRLTPEGLIQRLMNRREYLLAIRLSEQLKLATSKILVHWASQKVHTSSTDEASILDTVVSRLSSRRGISFETIARSAYDEGRGHLAIQLLNYETRAGRQVPLLLSMSEDDLALDKAIASGDTDLIYFVLLRMKKRLPLASFFRTLSQRPLAAALVECSTRQQDPSLLKDMYYQDDRRLDGANLLFSDALAQPTSQAKIDKLKLATQLLADSTKDPNAALSQKMMTEAQMLIKAQSTLDSGNVPTSSAQTEFKYSGLSLNETIYHLILRSQPKRAQKLASEFSVSPKVYEWTRLRALVAARNWSELQDIASKNKRSPISWEAYFNEILGAGNTKLAGSVFVVKCAGSTVRQRAEMWLRCGMTTKAGEELVKNKDLEGLENLQSKVGADGAVELERMIASLKNKR